jgi:hypothetical protein
MLSPLLLPHCILQHAPERWDGSCTRKWQATDGRDEQNLKAIGRGYSSVMGSSPSVGRRAANGLISSPYTPPKGSQRVLHAVLNEDGSGMANPHRFRNRRAFAKACRAAKHLEAGRNHIYQDQYRDAVDEHISAAHHALRMIETLEARRQAAWTQAIHRDSYQTEDGPVERTRFDHLIAVAEVRPVERWMRTFLNEARAALDSLAFEVCNATHDMKGHEDDHLQFDNTECIRRYTKGIFNPMPLRMHFKQRKNSNEYVALNKMRNLSAHRRILSSPVNFAPHEPWEMRFAVPTDIPEIDAAFGHVAGLCKSLKCIEEWVVAVVDETYQLAVVAMVRQKPNVRLQH